MKPIPERFRVAKKTLIFDRFMNNFIMIGGLSIIAAVMGIFVFILLEILPLFNKAKVEEGPILKLGLPAERIVGLAVDEWTELPLAILDDGTLMYADLQGNRGIFEEKVPALEGHTFSKINYQPRKQELVLGTDQGKVASVRLGYRATFPDTETKAGEKAERIIVPNIRAGEFYPLFKEEFAVKMVDYGGYGENKLFLGVAEHEGKQILKGITLNQKRSLFGKGKLEVGETIDFTSQVEGRIQDIDVGYNADRFVITLEDGRIQYFVLRGKEYYHQQTFTPFENYPQRKVVTGDFIYGDVTFIVTNEAGTMLGYSLYLDPEVGDIQFGLTKTFENFPTVMEHFMPCTRNKAFLVSGGNYASLRYSTTEDVRWEKKLDFKIQEVGLSGKYDRMLFLDSEGTIHKYKLTDHHPQSGWRTFFGKIWYEGQPEPDFVWQSTGGTDDFEPKLSLVPLIVGSLKGTFFALLFAIPIALVAALYTSQFLTPEIKRVVKPMVEIMASLPSVVLGFLAALWLAPIVDQRVPSFLMMVLVIPLIVLAFGWAWQKLPITVRVKLPKGMEFAIAIPLVFLAFYLCWILGPQVEKILFVVTDPNTGKQVADFRLWWPETTGISYTQRNSLVVGFVMGFAVIPIIFTISEDAMSNVPQALRSGSLALGASRWQTAIKIVLPTAAAGIFSAVMIGFGRAVGETMIVVMATGNTPVMDLNIFSGMRTLSANIAVEIPEAPHGGTLYRGLFLGAMVLFLMTFFVNTIAEVMRQRLRERYKTVE